MICDYIQSITKDGKVISADNNLIRRSYTCEEWGDHSSWPIPRSALCSWTPESVRSRATNFTTTMRPVTGRWRAPLADQESPGLVGKKIDSEKGRGGKGGIRRYPPPTWVRGLQRLKEGTRRRQPGEGSPDWFLAW